MNHILGLDVSTSCTGISVIDENEKVLFNEAIKLSSSDSLGARAEIIQNTLVKLKDKYDITKIYVETPMILYQGGAGQASTVAILQRFNGMVSYIVRLVFGVDPIMVNVSSARAKLGIKIPRVKGAKQRDKKQPIIDWIVEHYKDTETPFLYDLTRFGNYVAGVDDRADSLVLCLAGPRLTPSKK